jgi:predicted NUDIX family NTP pyrophosphohydrolase
MRLVSAGLLMFRHRNGGGLEVLLVHPGGPLWAKKDVGVWSIPKGRRNPGEELLAAAIREFNEETGLTASGEFIALPSVKQPGGKQVFAWAIEGDCDPAALHSNSFTMEWPPRSGRMQTFPEVDRADWFTLPVAKQKILRGQLPLLDALDEVLSAKGD